MMEWKGIPYLLENNETIRNATSLVVEQIPKIYIDSGFPYEAVTASIVTGGIAIVALLFSKSDGEKNRIATLESVHLTLKLQTNHLIANEIRELVAQLGKKDAVTFFILDKLRRVLNREKFNSLRYITNPNQYIDPKIEIDTIISDYQAEYNEMVYIFNKIKLLIESENNHRTEVIDKIDGILKLTNDIVEKTNNRNYLEVNNLIEKKFEVYNELIVVIQSVITDLYEEKLL